MSNTLTMAKVTRAKGKGERWRNSRLTRGAGVKRETDGREFLIAIIHFVSWIDDYFRFIIEYGEIIINWWGNRRRNWRVWLAHTVGDRIKGTPTHTRRRVNFLLSRWCVGSLSLSPKENRFHTLSCSLTAKITPRRCYTLLMLLSFFTQ